MTAEDALHAAARTIGQMPEADIRSKFAELQAARKARTGGKLYRQEAEAASVELDEGGSPGPLSCTRKVATWNRPSTTTVWPRSMTSPERCSGSP